jgi:ubiquinone biosynthesis protein COQ4
MLIRKLERIASIAPRWNQLRRSRARCFSSTPKETPFYGSPRPEVPHRSLQNRLAVAIHSATTAFADPSRADAVAALGEITGEVSLRRIHAKMSNDPTGQLILQERPVVSKATIPYERLMAEAPEDATTPGITFGQAYGSFLKGHGFDPDARDQVKYVDDEELAYVMLRYRQVE